MSRCLAPAALGLAAVLLWPRPGVAQSPPVSPLTLTQALERARQRAPALLEAAGRVAEAEGRLAGASPLLRENPTLELGAGPRTLADDRRKLDLLLGLSQTVETGGQRGARVAMARAGVSGAVAQRQDALRLVLGGVAELFLRALHARERLLLAQASEAALRDLADSTRRRFEVGDVPVLDVNVARVALTRAQGEVVSAEGEVAAFDAGLRGVLGGSEAAPWTVTGDLGAVEWPSVLATEATGERPDIVALEAELEEARAQQRLGASSAWPDVGAGVRYSREGEESVVLGSLAIALPFFARGQENRATGGARARKLEAVLDATRRARNQDVEAARARYRARQAAVDLLKRDALPLLDENATLARKSYDAGELDLSAFLLVRRDALETRVAFLDGLLEAGLARVQLAVQTGALQ